MTEVEFRKCIDELDAAKAAVPDDFKWTGRPLHEMIADLAQAWRHGEDQLEEYRQSSYERGERDI